MNVVGFREVVMVLPVYARHCDQIAVTRTDGQLFGQGTALGGGRNGRTGPTHGRFERSY